ncbi:MAG: hypothetical protein HQL07_19590 [Nitrospirae bacterium]|nr:hypothetical protein [Magnetococcales bacterium]
MSIIFYILGGIVLAYWGFSIYQPSSNRPSVMRENGGIIFAVGIAPLAIGFVTSMIGFMSKLFIGAGVIVLAYWGFSICLPFHDRSMVMIRNGGIILAFGIALLAIGFSTSMIGFTGKLFIGAGVIVLAYWGFSINQLGGGLSGLAYDGFSLNQPSSNRPRVIRENGGIIFAVGIALLVIGFVT